MIGRLMTSDDTRRDHGGGIVDTRLVGFDDFDLKTTDAKFARYWPQNLGEDLGVAHGIIKELASRQSYFMKGS